MPFGLRENLAFTLVADRAIFLDVQADRYFCLPARANEAFCRLVHGEDLDGGQRDALIPLVQRGLLVQGLDAPRPRPPVANMPIRRRKPDTAIKASGAMVLRAVWSQVQAGRTLRRKALASVLDELRDRKTTLRARRDDHLSIALAIQDAFMKADTVISPIDRCLRRTIAMSKHLIAAGVAPDVYFGVRLPFAAHCWVQHDGCVVGDDEDHDLVESYSPILVL